MAFFDFLGALALDDPYRTGDEDVDELVDLLEHEPQRGGLLGVTVTEHTAYLEQIEELIVRLESVA